MRKDDINALMRALVKDRLSPDEADRNFVTSVYESIRSLLGEGSTLQIGSYPRFTAVKPLHDLDVLYILGNWDAERHDPAAALIALESLVDSDYENPTEYRVEVGRQTHSVTLTFLDRQSEVFSVDIVPAYVAGTNSFGDDTYVVPEIALKSRPARRRIYDDVQARRRAMAWIASDPRGYIEVARELNQRNPDFRKSAKFVKGWRAACKSADDDFPLKSFHAEVAIADYFTRNPGATIFDAVFSFFCSLPEYMWRSRYADRADPRKHIDAYVESLSDLDRKGVKEVRDAFLIQLENATSERDVANLISAERYRRVSTSEAFLFDQKIPVLTERDFLIVGNVLPRDGGFRAFVLDALGLIKQDREIEFRLGRNPPAADLFKWKVRNDANCAQPRGEITDHQTMRDPETTRYNGKHFVECFAIVNGVCIGRAKQNVELRWAMGAGG